MSKRPPLTKAEFLAEHPTADIVCNEDTGEIVAAVYYFEPYKHKVDVKKFWQAVRGMLLEPEEDYPIQPKVEKL
jgi:hypothetical protein